MESQLDQKIREYKELLDRKEELENLTKENNAAKEKLEQDICKMMIDEEKPSTIVDGFNYSLSQKVMYSKKSEEDLAALEKETGLSFFDVLRDQGLGDIIKETVNPRTLQSTVAAMKEDHLGEDQDLPEDLTQCLSIYEKLTITKRKANTKALDRAKKSKK